MLPPGTAFLWDGPDCLWRLVLLVLGPNAGILGWVACLRSPLALHFVNQGLRLLMGWVLPMFAHLGIDLWVFWYFPGLPGPPTKLGANPWFRGIVNMSRCSCNKDVPMYVEVSGQPAWSRPGGLVFFLRFCPSLGCDLLQAQLIQKLWNLLELNKICMERGAKTQFISEKLMVKM